MTPRKGLRFPSRPAARAACATGMLLLGGCGAEASHLAAGDADSTEPTKSSAASEHQVEHVMNASLEESLARLDALQLLETGDLYETKTVHQWVPYGGTWTSSEEPLSDDEAAARLEGFVAVAEAAVEQAGDVGASTDFTALCWDAGDAYCLTRDDHQADLDALNALEIVHVEGMVRDSEVSTGGCYSSWDNVTEEDCKRAYRVRAVVEATKGFPSHNPPEGEELP